MPCLLNCHQEGSHCCLGPLNDSQRDGLCGPAQNGHRCFLLIVAACVSMLLLVELQKHEVLLVILSQSMYISFRVTVCSSDNVHFSSLLDSAWS